MVKVTKNTNGSPKNIKRLKQLIQTNQLLEQKGSYISHWVKEKKQKEKVMRYQDKSIKQHICSLYLSDTHQLINRPRLA